MLNMQANLLSQAGETFTSVYAFADANNLTIPGGSDPSVGAAGGWLLGGGHSPVSHKYGLGVDRAVSCQL